MHTFEALRMEYKALWQRMEISQRAANKVDVVARKLLLSKHRYRAVAAKTGVPWFLIAVLHERESSADFTAHLHNGDPLELRTYHVPAGQARQRRAPIYLGGERNRRAQDEKCTGRSLAHRAHCLRMRTLQRLGLPAPFDTVRLSLVIQQHLSGRQVCGRWRVVSGRARSPVRNHAAAEADGRDRSLDRALCAPPADPQ